MIGQYREIERLIPYEWQFGTLLADFYAISGWSSLIGICAPIFLVFTYWFKLGSINGSGPSFILMVLYFHIMVQGVFYFSLGNSGGNYYILLMLLLAFVFRAGAPVKKSFIKVRSINHRL